MIEQAVVDSLEDCNDAESHTELNPHMFHPSQLSMCKRQMYLSKLGIKQPNTKLLGIFQIGTMMHEFVENHVPANLPFECETEKLLEGEYWTDDNVIKVVGHTDLYIPEKECVVDYKSQNGWNYFNPYTNDVYEAKERHITQLILYMSLANAERGKLVYMNKSDFEVRETPQDGFIEKDKSYIWKAIQKAENVCVELRQNGYPESKADIPYDKCGCFVCNYEDSKDFTFDHLRNKEL